MIALTKLKEELQKRLLNPEQVGRLINGNKRYPVISSRTVRRATHGFAIRDTHAEKIAKALRVSISDLQ